jgi:MoaD family protein
MKVTMRFFTILKEITKKNKEELEVPSTTTLADLLHLLSQKYGHQFKNYVYAQNGQMNTHLQVLINWVNITTLNGVNTTLQEHDEIAIIPPVSGG